MKELQPHPAARLFPMLSAEEMRELAKDIRERGLLSPIILHKGEILDGRNRYIACGMAGVEPRFADWDGQGGSPTAWVLSTNLHRRHLTTSQRAGIAVESLALLEAEARERQVAALNKGQEKAENPVGIILDQREKGRSREKAAAAVGVSPASVAAAKRIKAESPETFEQILAGAKTISEAKRELNPPAPGEHAPQMHALKTAFTKASDEERIEFLEWANAFIGARP